MTTAWQPSAFQNNAFQIDTVVQDVKTGTGGIDPVRRIIKPTGILHLPKKGKLPEKVEQRIEEAAREQAEIANNLAKEFSGETQRIAEANAAAATLEMSMAEVDREIAALLQKKLRTQEDEILLLLLMVAAAA